MDKYGNGLEEKEEIILLTKADLVDSSTIEKARKALKKYGKEIMVVSVLDDEAVKKVREVLTA